MSKEELTEINGVQFKEDERDEPIESFEDEVKTLTKEEMASMDNVESGKWYHFPQLRVGKLFAGLTKYDSDGIEFFRIFTDPNGTAKLLAASVTALKDTNGILILANAINPGSVAISPDAVDIVGHLTVFANNLPLRVTLNNLPISDPGVEGRLWRSGTDLRISTG